MPPQKEITVQRKDHELRLDRWLKENAPEIPFSLMQKLLRKGAIRVNGDRAKTSHRVQAGQVVTMPDIKSAENQAKYGGDRREIDEDGNKIPHKKVIDPHKMKEYFTDQIIFQNKHLLAINKLHGLATQGGTGIKLSVDDLAREMEGVEEAPRIIHRLDKDTSGVLLMAMSRRASQEAMLDFKGKEFQKTYWALIKGVPARKEGKIDIPLEIVGGSGGEKTVPSDEGKRAVTYYKVIETAGQEVCWVALSPESGRKHQIRAHLVAIGHPIIGDGKYGGTDAFVTGLSEKMHLHARRMQHDHFLGSSLDVTAELPPHMKESWKTLGFDNDDNDPFLSL